VSGVDKGDAERLKRIFRNFPPAVEAEVSAALDKAAAGIRDRARKLVPYETGELHDAIEVRDDLEGFTGTGAVGSFARGGGERVGGLRRYIGVFPERKGSKGWYAVWVEFGTAARVKGSRVQATKKGLSAKGRRLGKTRVSGNTHSGTRAQPFLFPAYFGARKKTEAAVGRAINRAARKVVRTRLGLPPVKRRSRKRRA